MKVIQYGPVTRVILSRRNLLALLAKMDGYPPDSGCSIEGGSDAQGYVISAEEDNIHYRDRPAGRMHPVTEPQTTRPPTGTVWGIGPSPEALLITRKEKPSGGSEHTEAGDSG